MATLDLCDEPGLTLGDAAPVLSHLGTLGIGSKDGALPHYCGTFPPSALRTGRATPRCIRLASIIWASPWLSSTPVMVVEMTGRTEPFHLLLMGRLDQGCRTSFAIRLLA